MARPCSFTTKVGDKICILISEGCSLREVCRMPDMPDRGTVLRWLTKPEPEFQEFYNQYAKAIESRAQYWAEEILDIADDSSNDWVQRNNSEGDPILVADREHINRSRLRVDTRKWLLSKLLPKKYGEKVVNEITGKDGESFVPTLKLYLKSE